MDQHTKGSGLSVDKIRVDREINGHNGYRCGTDFTEVDPRTKGVVYRVNRVEAQEDSPLQDGIERRTVESIIRMDLRTTRGLVDGIIGVDSRTQGPEERTIRVDVRTQGVVDGGIRVDLRTHGLEESTNRVDLRTHGPESGTITVDTRTRGLVEGIIRLDLRTQGPEGGIIRVDLRTRAVEDGIIRVDLRTEGVVDGIIGLDARTHVLAQWRKDIEKLGAGVARTKRRISSIRSALSRRVMKTPTQWTKQNESCGKPSTTTVGEEATERVSQGMD